MSRPSLARQRWAVRGILALGVAASVSANVLHARDNLISQVIAAWPPLALLATVELVAKIPIQQRILGVVRVAATMCIAGIAAYASYFHMATVVSQYGEHPPNPYLLPFSVDGLIVVGSVCLVELGTHTRRLTTAAAPPPTPAAASVAAAAPATGATAVVNEPAHAGDAISDDTSASHPAHASAQGTSGLTPRTPDPDRLTNAPHDKADDRADTDSGEDLAPDLAPLLAAAQAARDELRRDGRPVTRDALAAQMRRNGHSIRTARVSELVAALHREPDSPNGHHPTPAA